MSSALSRLLSWLVAILVPIVLVLMAVRLLMTPAYLSIEYSTPGFPMDRYGFTKEDRLYWSKIAVRYLLNSADISFLGNLRFPDGEQTPQPSCQFMDDCSRFYNDRELKHMFDVKNVVQTALWVFYGSVIILTGLGVWGYFGGWYKAFKSGLRRGGWLTVGLLGAIMFFVLIAFGFIFVLFHSIFFEAGTWTFLYSDTLIRLFPERFWRDTFIAVGVLAGGAGLALGVFVKDGESA